MAAELVANKIRAKESIKLWILNSDSFVNTLSSHSIGIRIGSLRPDQWFSTRQYWPLEVVSETCGAFLVRFQYWCLVDEGQRCEISCNDPKNFVVSESIHLGIKLFFPSRRNRTPHTFSLASHTISFQRAQYGSGAGGE